MITLENTLSYVLARPHLHALKCWQRSTSVITRNLTISESHHTGSHVLARHHIAPFVPSQLSGRLLFTLLRFAILMFGSPASAVLGGYLQSALLANSVGSFGPPSLQSSVVIIGQDRFSCVFACGHTSLYYSMVKSF